MMIIADTKTGELVSDVPSRSWIFENLGFDSGEKNVHQRVHEETNVLVPGALALK